MSCVMLFKLMFFRQCYRLVGMYADSCYDQSAHKSCFEMHMCALVFAIKITFMRLPYIPCQHKSVLPVS